MDIYLFSYSGLGSTDRELVVSPSESKAWELVQERYPEREHENWQLQGTIDTSQGVVAEELFNNCGE